MKHLALSLLTLAAILGARSTCLAQRAAAELDPPVAVPSPPDVSLSVPEDLRLAATRLGDTFTLQMEQEEGGRIGTGLLEALLGATNAGLGAWFLFDDGLFGSVEARATFGALSLVIGLSTMITGVYRMITPGYAYQRHARWRAAIAGGLTERELGRFEGELRAEAEVARFLRTLETVNGFANVVAGLGMVLATALAPLDTMEQIQGYTLGSGLAVVGLIGALAALFSESQAETAWRLYRAGEGPESASRRETVDLRITPSVGADHLGVQIGGTF